MAGDHSEALSGYTKASGGHPQSSSSHPEALSGHPEVLSGHLEALSDLTEAPSGQPKAQQLRLTFQLLLQRGPKWPYRTPCEYPEALMANKLLSMGHIITWRLWRAITGPLDGSLGPLDSHLGPLYG